MIYDKNNVFARIIRGEIPAKIVYEDNEIIAINDLYPKAPVHVLVIPKGNYINLEDFVTSASEREVQSFFRKATTIAQELGLGESGFRIVANTGENGGQTIFHFHLHILGGEALSAM